MVIFDTLLENLLPLSGAWPENHYQSKEKHYKHVTQNPTARLKELEYMANVWLETPVFETEFGSKFGKKYWTILLSYNCLIANLNNAAVMLWDTEKACD